MKIFNLERRSIAINITVIEPDAEKNRALAIKAAYATAGIPVTFTLDEVTNKDIIEKLNLPETPAIAINGEVKVSGKFLEVKELKELYMENLKTSIH